MTDEAGTSGDQAALGAARVEIVGSHGQRRVVKTGAARNECVFYGRVAERLNPHGIETPRVFQCDEAERRLVLEHIPYPITLPADRSALLGRLARLHTIPCIEGDFHDRVWTDEHTRQAADLLGFDRAARGNLKTIQSKAAPLFAPVAMICGDSNPGNWARREDGGLVQFDWERFGFGHPALDIAPLAGFLPDRAEAESISAEYIAGLPDRSGLFSNASELGRQTRIAVAWLFIDVICMLSERRHPLFERYRTSYGKQLPAWLADVVSDGCRGASRAGSKR